MKQRIISAAIGVAALLVILYFRGFLLDMAMLILGAAGIFELHKAFALKGTYLVLAISILSLVALALTVVFFDMQYLFFVLAFAAMLTMLLPVFSERYSALDVQSTIFSLIYPSAGFVSIIALNHIPSDIGFIMIIGGMLFAWGCDSGAYFAGYLFGRHPLCPRISPKKTVEGSIGGIVVSAVLGLVYGLFIQNMVYADVSWYNYIIIALLSGIISQLGDLAASAVKRYYGIKDFGKFMPGHGGVLDRFDSIVYVMPLVYVYTAILLGR
ncbi:CDP-archaeol synthase [Mahella sp.]|uniref:phosphatidate cytidylyltransferase n=1 Tax=Mahella sp. TaxID=2798721 RepID=UPI0025C6159F|nr:CDP-archaeol synthase [Mahella sp.]MBZ4665350.1 phosphatidate cytidylyltransferase [Mahella sp.]MDK2903289.1 phosphatidate cytidylyltransferase [Clostridiales bacterium]